MESPTDGFTFVERFKSLIAEAEAAGFEIDIDVRRDPTDSTVLLWMDIDLNDRLSYIDTIKRVEW